MHNQTQPNMVRTKKIADIFGVQRSTVNRQAKAEGHFMGIVPIKLPNGRYLWDMSEAKAIIDQIKIQAK